MLTLGCSLCLSLHYTHTHTHTNHKYIPHTYTHTNTHSLTPTHTHTYHPHTYILIPLHTSTPHTHTHHTHTHTHIHTHHTHTYLACSKRNGEYFISASSGLMTGFSISRAKASFLFLSSWAHTSSHSSCLSLPWPPGPETEAVMLLILTDWPLCNSRILVPRSLLNNLCVCVCVCV